MTQPATRDRRRRFRYGTADLEATLDDAEVHLIDLSLTGVGILTDERLQAGAVRSLRLDCETGVLQAEATVVWCSDKRIADDNGKKRYRAGLKFPPLPAEDAEFLFRIWRWQSQRSDVQPKEREEDVTSEFDLDAILHYRRKTESKE